MTTTHAPKSTADKGKAIAHELSQKFGGGGVACFADNRTEAAAMDSQIQLMRNSVPAQKLAAVQRIANGNEAVVQRVPNLVLTPLADMDLAALLAYADGTVIPWLDTAVTEAGTYSSIARTLRTRLNAILGPHRAAAGIPGALQSVSAGITDTVAFLNARITAALAAPAPEPEVQHDAAEEDAAEGGPASASSVPSASPTPVDYGAGEDEEYGEPDYLRYKREQAQAVLDEKKSKGAVARDEEVDISRLDKSIVAKYLSPAILAHMAGEYDKDTGKITGGHLLLAMQTRWGADLVVNGTPADGVWAGTWTLKSRKKGKKGAALDPKASTFFPQGWTQHTLVAEIANSAALTRGRFLKTSNIEIQPSGDTYYPVLKPSGGGGAATSASGGKGKHR